MKKTLSLILFVMTLVLSIFAFSFGASAQYSEGEEKESGDFKYVTTAVGAYITEYTGNDKTVKIPEKIDGNTVVGIEAEAFWYNRELESVEFPESLVVLGGRAFQGCQSLRSVVLPQSVTNIEDACFAQCVSLENINIPENIYYVGGGVFDDTPFIENYKDDSVILDDRIYYSYRGTSDYVEIPEGVTCISASAFLECESIVRVDIPETVEIIGGYAFYGCDNLKSIRIPRSAMEIGPYAFGCYTETGNPEPQTMEGFTIYGYGTDAEGAESTASAYAKDYGFDFKPASEEPLYVPEENRPQSKISAQTVLIIVFSVILVIVVGGGMLWGFISDKKAKEEAKSKRNKYGNKKKNKR